MKRTIVLRKSHYEEEELLATQTSEGEEGNLYEEGCSIEELTLIHTLLKVFTPLEDVKGITPLEGFNNSYAFFNLHPQSSHLQEHPSPLETF
ncbi:unnamed protein product [Linum trigynum]|uniref:Uncharacterized protein n=1 Tax=Linum trigynum TaxID=586398 RepID=A0AAV2CL05_9ROSI